MPSLSGCGSPSEVPGFRLRYVASIVLSAVWFPLAYSLVVILSEALGQMLPHPNWLDMQIAIPLSLFAAPTGAVVGAVVFYFFRRASWTANFLLVVLASVAVAIFSYCVGGLGHGWVGFG